MALNPDNFRNDLLMEDSRKDVADSATAYLAVSIAGADYAATKPFKGINTATAGLVTVTGLDGVDATLYLTAGFNPSGGIGAKTAGSTVTSFTLCF